MTSAAGSSSKRILSNAVAATQLVRLKSCDEADLHNTESAANKTPTARKASESSVEDDGNAPPTKPLRPLSAYHLFFQLERVHILKEMSNDDAHGSPEHKILLENAPKRYEGMKVFRDWHARPGKRQRRKHRKSHGQIGFQELSKAISKRWAEIDKTDPDVKKFVQNIANRELEEYQRDMTMYKELTKHLPQETKKADKTPKSKKPPPSETRASPSLVSQDGKAPEDSNQVAAAAMLLMQVSHEVSGDKCQVCKKEGDLIACELCSKVYHAECVDLDMDAIPIRWHCSSCSSSPPQEDKTTPSPPKRRKSLLGPEEALATKRN